MNKRPLPFCKGQLGELRLYRTKGWDTMNTRMLVVLGVLLGVLHTSDAQASRGGQRRGEWRIGWVHVITKQSAPLFDGTYGAVLAVSRTEPTECLEKTGKIYGGWWQPVDVSLDELRLIANACDLLETECDTTPLPEHKIGFEGYGYVAQDVAVQWFAPNADCAREAVDYLLEQIDN